MKIELEYSIESLRRQHRKLVVFHGIRSKGRPCPPVELLRKTYDSICGINDISSIMLLIESHVECSQIPEKIEDDDDEIKNLVDAMEWIKK